MQQRVFTIAENAPVARDTYRLQLTGDTAAITAPGQFVDIRLAGRFLRRPVSVCSWSDGALTLYYKVAGAGPAQLSTLVPGTELDLLGGQMGTVTGKILTGSMDAYNDFDTPNTVSIQSMEGITVENGQARFTLPACSVAEITLA